MNILTALPIVHNGVDFSYVVDRRCQRPRARINAKAPIFDTLYGLVVADFITPNEAVRILEIQCGSYQCLSPGTVTSHPYTNTIPGQ